MALATLTIDINARLASIEKDMGRAAQIAERNAQRMDKAFSGVAKTIGALGGVMSVGAFASWVKSASDAAVEIGKLSSLAGTGAQEFQKYAAGAKTVGFEADKLADILKDVNDKTGEYLATGGGPLKDFFEQIAPQIGLTAEAFRGLSGPQALQLYYNALEQANVSQAKATFYMEALANDATALIPLLRDNGSEFRRIANEAEALGLILDDKLIRSSKEFNENLDRLQGLSRSVAAEIGNVLIPAVNELAEEFLDARRAGLSFMEALVTLGTANPGAAAEKQVARVKGELADLRKEMEKPWYMRSPTAALAGDGRIELLEKELKYWELQAKRDFDRSAFGPPVPPPSAAPGQPPSAEPPRRTGRTGSRARTGKTEAERQAEAIARQIKALEEQAATFGLSEKSAALYKLSMEGATQAQIENAEVLLTEIETLKQRSEEQGRLNDLLAATPTAQLDAQRQTMLFLAEAFEAGRISAQQFEEAAITSLGNVGDKAEETGDVMTEFARSAAEGMQRAMADFLFDPFADGLDGMLQGFGQMIQRMIAEAVAADLANRLFGDLLTGGSGSNGWIGAGLEALFSANGNAFAGSGPVKAFASGGAFGAGEILTRPTLFRFADGGAFRTGVAGEAGPEAALPLARMANGKLGVLTSGGRGQTINLTVNVASGTPSEVRRAAGAGAREALAAFSQSQRYA